MSLRLPLTLAAAGALAAAAIGTSTASADKATTAQSNAATLTVVGGPTVRPGVSVTDNQRFNKRVFSIASGGTLTIRNRARSQDPHTFSLVGRTQQPKTANRLNSCFEGGVCGQLFQAHEVPEGDGPPGKPVVNVGGEGFDQRGDSVVFAGRDPVRVRVTADEGSTLWFMCAVHPWMQGRLNVR